MRNGVLRIFSMTVLIGACAPKSHDDHTWQPHSREFVTLAPVCDPLVLRDISIIEAATTAQSDFLLPEDQQEKNLAVVLESCHDLKVNHPHLACRRHANQTNDVLVTSETLAPECAKSQARLSILSIHHLLKTHSQIDYEPTHPAPAKPEKSVSPRFREIVKKTPGDFIITVKDANQFLNLIFDERKFIISGQIYDSRAINLNDSELNYKTRCTGINPEQRFLSAADLREKDLTVMTVTDKNESFRGGVRRVLSMTFNEVGVGFVCVKANPYTDFEWQDVQKALEDVIEVHAKIKPPPPPLKAKYPPVDEKGFCHFDLSREYQELIKAKQSFEDRLLSLAMKEVYAETEPDRAAYRREIRQSALGLIRQCREFDMSWREFTCRPFTQEGNAVRIDSLDIKKACDHIRSKVP